MRRKTVNFPLQSRNSTSNLQTDSTLLQKVPEKAEQTRRGSSRYSFDSLPDSDELSWSQSQSQTQSQSQCECPSCGVYEPEEKSNFKCNKISRLFKNIVKGVLLALLILFIMNICDFHTQQDVQQKNDLAPQLQDLSYITTEDVHNNYKANNQVDPFFYIK